MVTQSGCGVAMGSNFMCLAERGKVGFHTIARSQ